MVIAQKTLISFDIAIDSRENTLNPIFKEALSKQGLRVIVTKLEEGDFYLPSKTTHLVGVVVERKTWDDLASSVIDKRIWSQANRLRELSRESRVKVYIVIEGDPYEIKEKREMPFNALLSVLDSIQNNYGFTVLFIPDKETLIDWLKYMAHKLKENTAKEEAKAPLIVQKPLKKTSIDDKIKAVVQVLAGPTIGERLLRKFGSLKNIVNASVSELMTVEGIGENRAKELFLVFNKKVEE
jgi:DNA excision repair protein ERCC-4